MTNQCVYMCVGVWMVSDGYVLAKCHRTQRGHPVLTIVGRIFVVLIGAEA